MTVRRLRLFLRHATIIIGVETLKHAGAHRRELSARDRAVAICIRVRMIAAATAMTFTLSALWPLQTFRRGDHAITIGIEARKHLRRPRQEFLARNAAVIVRVRAG